MCNVSRRLGADLVAVGFTCIEHPGCDIWAEACLAEVKLSLCCLSLEPANVRVSLKIECLADTPVSAHGVAQGRKKAWFWAILHSTSNSEMVYSNIIVSTQAEWSVICMLYGEDSPQDLL